MYVRTIKIQNYIIFGGMCYLAKIDGLSRDRVFPEEFAWEWFRRYSWQLLCQVLGAKYYAKTCKSHPIWLWIRLV